MNYVFIGLLILLSPSNTYALGSLILELDAGSYIEYNICDHDGYKNCTLSTENPVGIVRLGYEYKMFHTYYQHMSSISDRSDVGIDVIMVGLKLRMKI